MLNSVPNTFTLEASAGRGLLGRRPRHFQFRRRRNSSGHGPCQVHLHPLLVDDRWPLGRMVFCAQARTSLRWRSGAPLEHR